MVMKLKSIVSIVFCIGVVFNLHGQILPAAFGVATPSRPVANPIISSGLVLYLDAGNTASYSGSGTTWTDLSSSGNNGVLTNGPTYSSLNGGSIVFDGSNDIVSSFSTQISGTGSKTISSWIKLNTTSRGGIAGTRSLTEWGWGFTVNRSGVGTLDFYDTQGSSLSAAAGLGTNIWYHVTVTFDDSRMVTLYVNGSQVGISSTPFAALNASTFKGVIGNEDEYTNPFYHPFKGNIAQVSIYNRALTAAEVLENYNALRPRFLSIGDSYGGGKLAYVLKSGDPGYDATTAHGLIAATSDYPTRIQWWNGTYLTAGATATALGTGFANTNTIIAAQGTGSYAASVARNHTGGGYTDWYLPSKDELFKLNLNKNAIGGFVGDWYYSSSENTDTSPATAWLINNTNGSWWPNVKPEAWSVRPVRAF
jgi:hypothetical protein